MLPLFYDIFIKTKEKPTVIVSQNYAPTFEGVSYVEPVVYNETYDRKDQKAAQKIADFAKIKFQGKHIVFLNPIEAFMGKIPQETDSFVKEFWKIAGRPHEWGTLPLVFDQRNQEREDKLAKDTLDGRPLILAALTGLTSPFPQKDELMAMLREQFPDCQVLDLFTVRAERFYDLLGLFDRAKLLVTVDTAHLHLARASGVETIALARDYPSNWNGSPWHKRFRFYCRYGEFGSRKGELMQAAQDVVNDVPRVRTRPIEGLHKDGYNGSLIRFDGKLLLAYRYHPQPNPRTKLAMAILDDNLNVTNNQEIRFPQNVHGYSLEDSRLFEHQGKLWMSYTVSTFPHMPPKCVIQYVELVFSDGTWSIKPPFQPKYPGNDFTTMQKNWVFFDVAGKLFCIYGIFGESQIAFQIEGDTVLPEHFETPAPKWDYGIIRGGAIIPWKGKLLRFFHSRTSNGQQHNWWRYHVGAALMEAEPPFKTLAVSKHPILSGHEWRPVDCFHAKHNCTLPYGVVQRGEGWTLSIGLNDATCCTVQLEERQLRLFHADILATKNGAGEMVSAAVLPTQPASPRVLQ